MIEKQNKRAIAVSEARVWLAVNRILVLIPDFTGQFELEVHCKDGVVKDVYEVKSRRKV